MSRNSSEAFYVDENGNRGDGDIHYPILDAAPDDTKFRHESFLRAVEAGIPPERAAKMFGIEGAFDLGPGALG
jgi:hypothetical protein